MKWYSKYETNTTNRWQQVPVLMSESLSHSFKWFTWMADSFRNKTNNCLYECLTGSFDSFKNMDSFSNETLLFVAQKCKTVLLWKYCDLHNINLFIELLYKINITFAICSIDFIHLRNFFALISWILWSYNWILICYITQSVSHPASCSSASACSDRCGPARCVKCIFLTILALFLMKWRQ